MDNKKAIELIKLSTIGCAGTIELATLNSLMQEDENFPWKELGEFQNLVALLPSALILETPSWELKDRVARKLYELRDEVKYQQEEPESVEEPVQTIEQSIEETEEGVSIQEDLANFKAPDLSQIRFQEHPPSDIVAEDKFDRREQRIRTSVDKDLIEKTTKEYFSTYFDAEIKLIQRGVKKNLFLSIILFILAILMIVFMYLKFSGDIDAKQEEIDKLKKRLGVSLLESNGDKFFT